MNELILNSPLSIVQTNLSASLSAIVLKGNIEPKQRLISLYFKFIDQFKHLNTADKISNAYLAISGEYIKVGAFNSALKCTERSLDLYKGHEDTYHYKQTLLLKCFLLFIIQNHAEAYKILHQFQHSGNISDFTENITYLNQFFIDPNYSTVDQDKLSIIFKNKYKLGIRDFNKLKLNDTEDELVYLLSLSRRLESELLNHFDFCESSLASLISDINIKHPGLIEYDKTKTKFQLSYNEEFL